MANILFYGPGGTGKSRILRDTYEQFQKEGISSCITAPTGCAAINIGGTTLHHWAGIIPNVSEEVLIGRISRGGEAKRRILGTQALFIDEISMVGASLFFLVSKIACSVKQDARPFGGIRIVCAGDFLQLQPINDRFVFQSELWQLLRFEIRPCFTPYRYPDPSYFQLLMRVRLGEPDEKDLEILESRKTPFTPDGSGVLPTCLFAKKIDSGELNLKELKKLPGESMVFHSVDSHSSVKATKILDQIIDANLVFKVGAQVMLISNLDLDGGLFNGSRGVVIGLTRDSVKVRFRNSREEEISRAIFSRVIENEPRGDEAAEGEKKNNKITITRSQIPLILAWALSIHKSQGSTLDCAIVDIGRSIFQPGMSYVCLSRVRSLDGLFIKSFYPASIYSNSVARDFDRSISM